jgi:hypothetical protein
LPERATASCHKNGENGADREVRGPN